MNAKPGFVTRSVTLLSFLLLAWITAVQAEDATFDIKSDPAVMDPFYAPGLKDPIEFWTRVFALWRRDQVVLHDDENLGLVYEVIHLPGDVGDHYRPEHRRYVERRRQALSAELSDLQRQLRDNAPLTLTQKALLAKIEASAGRQAVYGAADRLRSQRGMRERFVRGVEISGRYDKHMRDEFRVAGLPEDLAYLPHIESSFVNRAQSSAGAVGAWQFMPGTGRMFLTMNRAVDERYDPVLAARGAARYLGHAYDRLEDWGLAVTSYNHGIGGMARARNIYGPDIERIVRDYKGPGFGFASRNFYAEFLATREIFKDLPRHFPTGVYFEPPIAAERVRLDRSVTVGQLAATYGVNRDRLASINPALTASAVLGRVSIPEGCEVWLPKETNTLAQGPGQIDDAVHSGDVDPYAAPYPSDAAGGQLEFNREFRDDRVTLAERQAREGTQVRHKTALRASGRLVKAKGHKVTPRQAKKSKSKSAVHRVRRGEPPHHIAAK